MQDPLSSPVMMHSQNADIWLGSKEGFFGSKHFVSQSVTGYVQHLERGQVVDYIWKKIIYLFIYLLGANKRKNDLQMKFVFECIDQWNVVKISVKKIIK